MKSTDERMKEALGRARAREVKRRRLQQRAVALGGGALSVVLIVLVGVTASSTAGQSGTSSVAGQLGLMGSVFTEALDLGYVVVGLLGFALGVAVAALAYRFGRNRSTDALASGKAFEESAGGDGGERL